MEETALVPRVTALIVSRNCAAALRSCLDALERSNEREKLEIIVVDNGSRDESGQLDHEFPGIHLLRLPKNFGLAKALNIGIRTAKGDSVLLLRPEYQVLPETIPALAATLESDEQVGAVCPYVERTYRLPTPEVLASFWDTGELASVVPVASNADAVAVEYPRDAPMLVRRKFLAGMNYFDERFGEFGPELELCYQIRGGGKTILVLPQIPVERQTATAEDSAMHSADRALGSATYIRKHFGGGAAFAFRLKAILGLLGRVMTFRNPGYNFQRLSALISGQKIDGTQVDN
jgi:N-acetylglucosaminyl-diphospho-decaprenol L-rhamnosyltransferase